MIRFYWMDSFQSQHRTKETAFKKALSYLKRNGIQRKAYCEFVNTKNQSQDLKLDFENWLYNNADI